MFETGSDRRVFCPASSAACGKHSGDGERDSGLARKVFGIAPERRSPSGRNRVRDQPGIVFGFIPESRSGSPGFPNETLPLLRKAFFIASAMAARLCCKNDQPRADVRQFQARRPLSCDEA
jgi:hypothetical protein